MTELNRGQKAVCALLEEGRDTAVMGMAGTGKTTAVRTYCLEKERQGYTVIRIAPYGLIASDSGGQTIHSFLRIRPDEFPDSEFVATRIAQADIIQVDEAGLMTDVLFDKLWYCIDYVRRKTSRKPQIILVGDTMQSHPVGGDWFFRSEAWNNEPFDTIKLTEGLRQRDPRLFEMLCRIGYGDFGPVEELLDYYSRKEPLAGATHICARNEEVNFYNNTKAALFPGEEININAITEAEFVLRLGFKMEDYLANRICSLEQYKRGMNKYIFPSISLKKGMPVMTLANDGKHGYMNGTIGYFEAYDPEVDKLSLIKADGTRIYINRLKCIPGSDLYQFPLRIAFAITADKAQGYTFGQANLDLQHCGFRKGCVYGAMTRGRCLDDMYLYPWITRRDLTIDADAIAFTDSIPAA